MSGADDRSGEAANGRPVAGDERPKIRRFYHRATTAEHDTGFVLQLDERPAHTPGRRPLAVPTRPLGEAIAEEWSRQDAHVDPATMPLTRIANTTIDGIAANADAVRAEIAKYSETDLICYRAESPVGLVERQAEHWDPLLDWAHDAIGARLKVASGLMPVAQDPDAMAAVRTAVSTLDLFKLGPAHVMTTLTGSAVLALAVLQGRLTPAEAWDAAHVDEDWQIGQWGEDAEAKARRVLRWSEMAAACRFAELAGVAPKNTLSSTGREGLG